jgi:uncharacterized protein YkwD
MRFAMRDMWVTRNAMRGPLLLTLLGAMLAFAFQASAATERAAAGSACKRYGDHGPSNLTPKHARMAVVCLINRKRHQNGRGHLHRSERLSHAATRHSRRMKNSGCFSHQCPGEASLYTRLRSSGYLSGGLSRWAYGENIGWGDGWRGTPKHIVNAWMDSSSHRSTILSGTFRDVGVGFAHRGSRGYYTADFGMRAG